MSRDQLQGAPLITVTVWDAEEHFLTGTPLSRRDVLSTEHSRGVSVMTGSDQTEQASKKLKAAIFDVDGVLLASPHERAWREALVGFADPSRFTPELYETQVAGKPRMAGASPHWWRSEWSNPSAKQ